MRAFIGSALALATALAASTAQAQDARAEIKNAEGKTVGRATLVAQRDGELSTAPFDGLPAGIHAVHIHEVGQCDPPFESAGGHFNPTGKQHGKDNPNGAHAGDLPNIRVPQDGRVKLETVAKNVSLN